MVKMDFRLLTVICIVSCLQAIRGDGGSNPVGNNNKQLNKTAMVDPSNIQESPMCSKLFPETFKSENCNSSAKLEDKDKFRCLLIDEIGNDVCQSDPKFNPTTPAFLVSIPSLCEWKVEIVKAGIPIHVKILLHLWNSQYFASCKNICTPVEGRNYSICDFIFNYYKDQLKTEISDKTKPSTNNHEDSKSVNAVVPENDGDLPVQINNDFNEDEDDAVASGKDNVKKENQSDGEKPPENVDDSPGSVQKGKVSKEDHISKSENNQENTQNEGEFLASSIRTNGNESEGVSHASLYFMLISVICIVFYFMMYNKKKILALVIEGRRRNVKRRPNSAAYSKLDCNLEEAMASGPSTSTSNTLLY